MVTSYVIYEKKKVLGRTALSASFSYDFYGLRHLSQLSSRESHKHCFLPFYNASQSKTDPSLAL
jgi:hypothetical protein